MAGLTKQHFNAIADIMRKHCTSTNDLKFKDELKTVCEDLAFYFKKQNALFNRERFIKACLGQND